MHHFHARNRLLAGLGALALAAAFAIGGAAPAANAHDSVLATVPSDTEHVDLAPATVSMRFTDDIMQLGAVLLVVDSAGTDWAEGEPALDGSTATVAVDPALPDGAYQVRWRVVSADGHPISGTFDFSVGSGAPAAPPTDAAAPAFTTPTDSSVVASVPPPAGLPIGVTALIGAVVGLAFLIGILALNRRRAASAAQLSSTRTEMTEQ
ncbi:copper resistance CopC family protein [Cryobacterium sp. PH31-O1]|uniref:copper resistance CopC family protein n=1 Tax=Cryobacterium sp. PH31-O1 TaxID=3046306 RepID=UPI0024BBB433|nr:copper resistance CopC family protein [Cryobacterium sp. PH31-O1]MDJ0337856.1 copper resistance protein CopC [Cryobacterium sp. PH31-O1]